MSAFEEFFVGSVVRLFDGRTGLITRVHDIEGFLKAYSILVDEEVIVTDASDILGPLK